MAGIHGGYWVSMKKFLSFDEALAQTVNQTRILILGNGFSIACKPEIFTYGSLFSQADFSLNPLLPKVFEQLGTQDFEIAINTLENSSKLVPIYKSALEDVAKSMHEDAQALKKILISTVTKNHPNAPFDVDEEEYFACRSFLSNFIGDSKGQIFTLNYDLLLYWTLMRTEFTDGSSVELVARDGFGDDDPEAKEEYVVWQGEAGGARSSVFFLHGALHLFDDGAALRKFTWRRTDKRLKDQAWSAIQANSLPLFVAEGTSKAKMNKITHNAYLFQAYRTLKSSVTKTRAAFFVHGHSLADSDDHILKLLGRGKFPDLYVGLHGDPSSDSNQTIVKRARALSEMRRYNALEVHFYDTSTAHVWG